MTDLKDKNLLTNSAVISLPQPPVAKAEDFLKAYNGYTYSAVSSIADAVASVKLHLFKRKFTKKGVEVDEIFEHEALSLLHFANTQMTHFDLVIATQTYLDLVGEAFWIMLRNNGKPAELYPVRPDWMSIKPSKTDIVDSYIYRPGGVMTEGIVFPATDVIHFKYFNPINPYRGKGSVQAAAMPIDIHTYAQEYNRNFFFNSALPGLVFTTDQKLNEQTIKRFMESWQQKFGGKNNSNKVAFVGGGLKPDKVSQTAKEMDFAEMQKMMRDDILAVFKVPKAIVGLTEDVNRANAEATTRTFMERVVTPRMIKFVAHLNEFFLPNWGEDIFFDFDDPAPEDTDQKLKIYESGLSLGWLTRNEVREQENLPPVEGGDVLYIPFSYTELGEEDQVDNKPDNSDDKKDEEDKSLFSKLFGSKKRVKVQKPITLKVKGTYKKEREFHLPIPPERLKALELKKLKGELKVDLIKLIGNLVAQNKKESKEKKVKSTWSDEKKSEYWYKMVSKTDVLEEKYRKILEPLFTEQENEMLRNVEALKYYVESRKKASLSSLLFSITEETSKFVAVLVPFTREVFIDKAAEMLDFLGVGGQIDTTTRDAIKFIRTDAAKIIKGINNTTRESLRKALAEGIEKGEGVEKLKKRVSDVYVSARGDRARSIARTEVLRATNFAATEAYRQSGVVKKKEWLTAIDERVEEGCTKLDGKIVAVNQEFHSDYFGISVPYPPIHVNCRCTTIPVF